MKKKLFLHIGLPKTGTTYLQCRIQFNRDKLKSNRIYVPKTGLNPILHDYNFLALALQPERWDQFPSNISASLPSLWHDFLEEIENCGYPNVLVSSETLSWELKKKEQIQTISERLHGYDVKIVLCGRDPYDFISSMYGHMLRTGRGPYSLESFLLEFPYYWSPEFHKLRWAEFFGKQNVLLLSYEELSGEFLFEKFIGAIFPGQEVYAEQSDFAEEINRNNSLSPRFLRFLEELSANQIDTEPYINLYLKSAGNFSPLESRTVTPADIDEALKRCGMALDFSNIVEDVAAQQRRSGEDWIELQEQIKAGLLARAPVMTTVMQELVESRKLLADRTERLEVASKDLVDRTRELVETRQMLVARTWRLEQLSKD